MAPVISVYSDFVLPNDRFILLAPYRVDCRSGSDKFIFAIGINS